MIMSAHVKKIFLLCLLLVIGFMVPRVYGQTPSPSPASQSSDLQKQINDLQSKISELQTKEKSLSSQIAVMDSQIRLTTLRIESARKQVSDLTLDIDTTSKKITKIEGSLDGLTKVLINRVVATYVVGSAPTFQVLLSSSDINDFAKRANYLRLAQAHDRRVLYDTVQAKNDYENQKELYEDKKQQIDELRNELEGYTDDLAREKADKDALLKITKSDEATYQQKLQAALAEQRAIQSITSGGGNAVSEGPVKEGDIIGYQISGRSACSSGTHLHFEVRSGGLQDPSNFLSNKNVVFDNSPDGSFSFNGSWGWPLNDTIRINQGYGMTYWARTGWYGGGPHTGIDMSSSSLAVKAVREGTLFRGSIACGGGQMPFARVDQSDGAQVYYMHIVQ